MKLTWTKYLSLILLATAICMIGFEKSGWRFVLIVSIIVALIPKTHDPYDDKDESE